ncbi:hypothetical protein TRFO_36959 [Tritrichomonas foetus]|uniref:Uncharacterized protein n=1 Tax=Tritrichomonas foetus TaxID=1144522 RepID=A0A1J4JC73_9EUKA|nr:hypothetical protein TRFO_36959 [Tritrichomonas foetus]|eukprot:OHS96802.1 hypothetical protein TRFO_36959 [Tritrichomonas foetus]
MMINDSITVLTNTDSKKGEIENSDSYSFEEEEETNQNIEQQQDDDNDNKTNDKPDEGGEKNYDSSENKNNEENQMSTFVTETSKSNLIQAVDISENDDDFDNNQRESRESEIAQIEPIDPAEIESALNSLLKYQTIPPEHYYDAVVQLINHRRIDHLEVSDYRTAEKLDKALDLMNKSIEELQKKQIEMDREQSLNNRFESLQNKLDEINDKYDSKIQQLQATLDEKLNDLTNQQEFQIYQFKEKWQNPDFLKQFDRPSKRLLTMRHLEKRMALSKRYEEAKKTKMQADKLQANEEAAMQKQMEEIMKTDFLKLRATQQQEVDKMARRTDALIEELELQREREIAPVKIAIKQFDIKKNAVTAKKVITVPKTPAQLQMINQNKIAPKTPKTAARIIKYRNECQADLAISPIDDEQFCKMMNLTNRQKKRAKSSLPPL